MIDSRHQKQIERNCQRINAAKQFNSTQKQMLQACVWAMADEFPDVFFEDIPTFDRPELYEFFCDAARHHWARLTQGDMVTPASLTSHAIHCPFGNATIIALVQLFERNVSLIWNRAKREKVF